MVYDRLEVLDHMGLAFQGKASRITSGGELVSWFAGTGTVGSAQDTYAWDDLSVGSVPAGGLNCLGVAITTVASGVPVAFATQGTFILPVGSTAVSGGEPVYAAGYGNMVVGGGAGSQDGRAYRGIGRALTGGALLTDFVIVRLSV